MDKDIEQIEKESRIYEAGFLIVPTVGEEHLGARVTAVRDAIESVGGMVIADEYPKQIDLAYPMVKVVANKRFTYHSAFFGWMKFEADPSSAVKIDRTLAADDNIIRYIVIKTVRENTMSPKKFVRERKMRDDPAVEERPKQEEKTVVLTEEELDKTIEDLVIS